MSERVDQFVTASRALRYPSVLFALAAAVLVVGCDEVDPPVDIQVEQDSWMRIQGTTTVGSFTCTSEEVYGGADIPSASVHGTNGRLSLSDAGSANLRVPVHSLDCGRKAMNQDLYEALRVGDHPEILFRLDRVEQLKRPAAPGEPFHFVVVGGLTIAGVERSVRVPVSGELLSDRMGHAFGRTRLNMTDFGVDPPTAVLGLVKVHDAIEVVFEVVGSIEEQAGEDLRRRDDRSIDQRH